eukprot:TRINITY_DN3702_c0_g1_i1.p1 TRINITY_DN3702_c0_g1~~TRINITY_DN3702_c0_g1_i1.p1  ORF type:complete len:694 (+),score=64.55 TRINITY_DN3702_c0_g1_i1:43-2124(+)
MCATWVAALAVCAAQGAASSTPTVHHESDLGSVNGWYDTPQEWLISCTAGMYLSITRGVMTGHTLTAEGQRIYLEDRLMTCPDDGSLSLVFDPYEGETGKVEFTWAATTIPTAWVRRMADHDVIDGKLPASDDWHIVCTPQDVLTMSVGTPIVGFRLTVDGFSAAGTPSKWGTRTFPVTCPSSGVIALSYRRLSPFGIDDLFVRWHPVNSESPYRHFDSHHGTINESYSTPQKWLLKCIPGETILMDIVSPVAGYRLTADGVPLQSGDGIQLTCPSRYVIEEISIVYVPQDGGSHMLDITWHPATQAPRTLSPDWQTPVPSPTTVHHVWDKGSVDAIYYAPQEWNISCMSNDTISMEVMHPVSGYALTADGVSLQPGKVNVTCPSSGALTLLYEPYDGHNHTVTVTWSPLIPPPPPTVHTMPVNGSIDANYSTSQEWAISCTPHHPMAMTVHHTVPGRSSLTIDGKSLYNVGVEWRLGCPSSGSISMLYTSHDHDSHRVEVSWSPLTTPVPSTLSPPQDTPVPPSTAVPTWAPSTMAPVRRVPSTEVHSMSDEDSASGSYSTPQKWRIACTPSTNLDVTVVQVPGQLTADTVSLGRGQMSVPCPHSGQVTLSYIPSGVNQMLSMRWVPEEQAASENPEEGGSGSAISSLVIVSWAGCRPKSLQFACAMSGVRQYWLHRCAGQLLVSCRAAADG